MASCLMLVVMMSILQYTLLFEMDNGRRKFAACRYGASDFSVWFKSYTECLDECRARPACTAVNYVRRFNRCIMHVGSAPGENTTSGTCNGVVFSEKAGWTKKVLPGCETANCVAGQTCVMRTDGSRATCVFRECPWPPPPIAHGTILGNVAAVDSTILYQCAPGSILTGSRIRTCLDTGQWDGTQPQCLFLRNCSDVCTITNRCSPNEYTIYNNDNQPYTVYCDFQSADSGYMYIHPNTRVHFTLPKQNHVIFRHWKLSDGTQHESLIGQISKYSSTKISVQYNSYTGYNRIWNTGMGPYLYVGLLPTNIASTKTTQGYSVDGEDQTFGNCDANGNSYFAFLFNDAQTGFSKTGGGSSSFMYKWITKSKQCSVSLLPKYYFSSVEWHFGGCGGYATVPNNGVYGATVGVRFWYYLF